MANIQNSTRTEKTSKGRKGHRKTKIDTDRQKKTDEARGIKRTQKYQEGQGQEHKGRERLSKRYKKKGDKYKEIKFK